jgi:hypothetical protein
MRRAVVISPQPGIAISTALIRVRPTAGSSAAPSAWAKVSLSGLELAEQVRAGAASRKALVEGCAALLGA